MKGLFVFMLMFLNFATHLFSEEQVLVDSDEKIISVLGEKDIVIIDVRTPKEFEGGALDNAINIDKFDKDFEKNIAILDKEKTYFVYCAAGGRSKQASNIMEKLGFKNIYNSKFGYEDIIKILSKAKK